MLEELQPGDPAQIGPYRLSGVLGTGGMGRVYLGWSASGQPVAVKVIRAELAGNPEFRARFRREVTAARTMNGRFTAPLADADLDDRTPWLATAYVSGPSLAEAVASYGPLPVHLVRTLAAGLAEALATIHGAGLVHRDLKPSNVLLASDGPRVIDFGISRAADTVSLTSTSQSLGSPGYLSPEQAVGRSVGPPTDIFSLGAVLAFAATGNGPFGDGSLAAMVYRVVHEPPSLDGLPAELRDLIGWCLAKDPGARPSAPDLLARLETARPAPGWLAGTPVAALHASVIAPPWQGGGDAPTSLSARRGAGRLPAGPLLDSATRADRGSTRRSRSPLLRRSVLVPALSVLAVLVAAAVALAATLGGPGGATALAGGSPTRSTSPQAGHLLASASASGKPAAAASAASQSQPAQPGQPAQPAQPGSTAQVAGPQTSSALRPGPTVTVTQGTHGASQPVSVTSPPPPSAPDAPPPTSPSPTPTITPFQEIHYSGAATVACSSDGSVKSGPALVPITLEVTNNTSETIVVYWINLNGALVLNADLAPGQIETFHTDEGDYWMISRSTGACFDIFLLDQAATLTAF